MNLKRTLAALLLIGAMLSPAAHAVVTLRRVFGGHNYVGLGANLLLQPQSELMHKGAGDDSPFIIVGSLVCQGPAHKAGMSKMSEILEIDGKQLSDLSLSELLILMDIGIGQKKAGETVTFIIRESVPLDQSPVDTLISSVRTITVTIDPDTGEGNQDC